MSLARWWGRRSAEPATHDRNGAVKTRNRFECSATSQKIGFRINTLQKMTTRIALRDILMITQLCCGRPTVVAERFVKVGAARLVDDP